MKKNNNKPPLINYFKQEERLVDINFQNFSLAQLDKNEKNALMYAIRNNDELGLSLKDEQWTYLIENSNLKHRDIYHQDALMYALKFYECEELNFSPKQWSYLINNSDLLNVDDFGGNALIYAMDHINDAHKAGLNKEHWDSLIKKSYLFEHFDGWYPIMYCLANHHLLNKEQLGFVINNTFLELQEHSNILTKLIEFFKHDRYDVFQIFWSSLSNKQIFIDFIKENKEKYEFLLQSTEVQSFEEKVILDKKIDNNLSLSGVTNKI